MTNDIRTTGGRRGAPYDAAEPRPRITFYIAALSTGGVGKMRLHLARELVNLGVRVDLLLGKAAGPLLEAVPPGVRVFELGTTHGYFSVPGLVRYLRRRRPAVLTADRLRLNIAVLRARRLSFSSTRLFTSVHIPLSLKLTRLKERKRRSQRMAIQRYYPLTDGIIAVSRGVADDMVQNLGLPEDKIHVVYNPVVTNEIDSMAGEAADHPWLLSGGSPIIMSAGRFTTEKDFPTLIRAFAKIRRKRKCKLIILGEGKKQGSMESLAAELGVGEDLALPGFVVNPYKYMAKAHLFVLSSTWEGFGNALAEAMAVGLPAVSTDCPCGPREILEAGRLGPLVPVGDVDALARAMDRTLDHPPDRDALRGAARRFTVEACADGYLKTFGLSTI
ncbi:MAG: glycosyltransferase [Desulfobacterales bacterium]|nr:glycosyltransferase [Desulfobacterales bacterium]